MAKRGVYNRDMRRIQLKTKGVNWAGIFGLIAAVLVVALGVWLGRDQISLTSGLTSDQGRPSLATTSPQTATDPDPAPPAPTGSYRPYSREHFTQLPSDAQVVLFFTADDCGRCTETDVILVEERAQIPADVFIYTVSYNEAVDLRRRYNVTGPHTFVQIDTLGKQIQRWRGSIDLESILAKL